MTDQGGWSLTESDPGIFTGILKELGVKGLEVEELYSLDESLLRELYPIHALIFLFKWIGSGGINAGVLEGIEIEGEGGERGKGYFAQQVITNACATLALLNATLNIKGEKGKGEIEIGEELSNLAAFSEGLDSESKGWTISNSEKIRSVHNSFARSDPYSLEDNIPDSSSEDAYHFIAYLPIGNKLYELDGLKASPVSHGIIPGGKENWTNLAKDVIEARIALHPAGEVHFNLMALTSRSTFLSTQLVSLKSELNEIQSGSRNSESSDWVEEQIREIEERLRGCRERFKKWDEENELRRHNFIGLIHGLLLEVAKAGKLSDQILVGKKEMLDKIELAKSKGKQGEEIFMDED